MIRTAHKIGQQTIEIDFDGLEEAMGVQNRISELFHERLLPEMELLFDEMVGPQHRAVIERLEIDCGELSRKNWEQEWIEKTIRSLKAELMAVDKKRIAPEELAEIFFYFLQHGRLPWNAKIESAKDLEEKIEMNAGFAKEFKHRLNLKHINISRLSQGFSSEFLNKIILVLIKDNEELASVISPEWHDGRSANLFKKPDYIPIFEKIEKAVRERNQEKRKEETVKQPVHKPGKSDEEDEGIYILNAGLVILHPFFLPLFENSGLVNEGQWVSEETKQLALQMMGFLATGKLSTEEFDMPLNKILCGMEISEPVMENLEIPEYIQTECEELIKAVIDHWRVLKNTGVDALRETFLSRAGKLTKVDNGWLLQVEQKAVDVLLSKLPWGIGTIKLPWMSEVLFTEWV